jgi:Ca2+-binding RTX toxin-like protein
LATINVTSTASLTSALKVAVSGDVIKLAAGTYSGLAASNLSFGSGITITSADPGKMAVLTDFTLTNVKGLTVSNVEMATLNHADLVAKEVGYWAFNIRGSENINFDHVKIHGSLDGDVSNDVEGLAILNSKNVTVTNSEFQQLERALAIGQTDNVRVSGNFAHDLRSDGFDFAEVGNIQVLGNTFRNFSPKGLDHPDAIQFWTSGTKTASHDILISQNVILRGDGANTQGIFLRDQLGTLPYQHVTITDNLVVGTGVNAIRVSGVQDLTVTNNNLVSLTGGDKTLMYVQTAGNVVATGNSAAGIAFDKVTTLTQDNKITGTVGDGGLAAIKAWIASHPTNINLASLGSSAASAAGGADAPAALAVGDVMTGDAGANVLTGNGKANLIQGMAGNDTLDGAGGADTLAGGTGDDTYVVSGNVALIVEKAGEGTDTVIARGDYVLPSNVENLVINSTVTNGWDGTGNQLNNVITGNAGANELMGLEGNDTLVGGLGADTLVGGVGADRMTGGAGADVFRFAPGSGKDIVADFGYGPDKDMLDISAFIKAGLKPVLTEVGGHALVSFANGDSITLLGVHASELGTPSSIGWIF